MRKKKIWRLTAILLLLAVAIAVGAALVTGAHRNAGKSVRAPTVSPAPAVSLASTPTPTPVSSETVDVAIVGSELEGMYLARAAADEGLKVKVIDTQEKPGGQLLLGEMLFLDETRDEQGKSLVQGRVKELFDGFKSGKIRKLPEFAAYYEKLSKGIPIESGVKLQNVDLASGQNGEKDVKSVLYRDKAGNLKRLNAGYWVENTDHGALVDRLDPKRLPGLEAFYGQDHIEYMSASIMMKFKNVDWQKFKTNFNSLSKEEKSKLYGGGYVDDSFAIGLSGMTSGYKASNDRVYLRGLNAVNQRDGEVLINALLVYTVNPADDKSIAEAVKLGNAETERILPYFRSHIVGWEKAEINGFPSYPYIREYNHYETDYVLQVSDMLGGRMFDDNVSIAGYPLDLQGTSANKSGIEMGRPDKYGMPLRSFLLKSYDNVILAGKNVGATAISYGSARIQPNTSIAAESIGIILGQLKGKKRLDELKPEDWPALHAYLESNYHLKLTGVTAHNKLAGWTQDEIRKLDAGQIVYTTYVKKRR